MPKHHSSHRSIHGKNFIILPIIFCVLILGICTLIIYPSTYGFLAMGELFFSDGEKTFSSSFENVFVPVPEDEEEEEASGNGAGPKKQKTFGISTMHYPYYGEQFGELIIEDCQINTRLFFVDGDIQLNNGVGVYSGSLVPGFGGTILVAGHNNTFFNGLKYAQKGQRVKIRTSYGNYYYEITDVKVKDHLDKTAYDLMADKENLIMYTCYPFDEIGLTPDRCFVYAKFISGPVVDYNS